MANLQAGAGPDAAAQFQNILDHPGRNELGVTYPLSTVGLERAATLSGDRIKARKEYRVAVGGYNPHYADPPLYHRRCIRRRLHSL